MYIQTCKQLQCLGSKSGFFAPIVYKLSQDILFMMMLKGESGYKMMQTA